MNFEELRNMPVPALLGLYGKLLTELNNRKILRTNNLLGDYAEYLVKEARGLRQAEKSNKGYDLVDDSRLRYEVKARRITQAKGKRELGAIRNLEAQQPLFDFLAGVLFNEDFSIYKACLVPFNVVKEHAKPCGYQHACKFQLHDYIWDIQGVRDITNEVKRTVNLLN
jgi:hypothetical protein